MRLAFDTKPATSQSGLKFKILLKFKIYLAIKPSINKHRQSFQKDNSTQFEILALNPWKVH